MKEYLVDLCVYDEHTQIDHIREEFQQPHAFFAAQAMIDLARRKHNINEGSMEIEVDGTTIYIGAHIIK